MSDSTSQPHDSPDDRPRSRWRRWVVGGLLILGLMQWWIGQELFNYECRTNEGFWWSGKVVHADSLAEDNRREIGGDGKGCSGDCLGSLTSRRNRMAFHEVLVHHPHPDYLAAEPGWHRFWLARSGAPECSAYAQSKVAQERLANALFDPNKRHFTAPPTSLCVAARMVDAPASRYLESIDLRSWMRFAFGISISSHELKDRTLNETLYRHQATGYFGPWLRDAFVYLSDYLGGLSQRYQDCGLPQEAYQSPEFSSKPISSLTPLTKLSDIQED